MRLSALTDAGWQSIDYAYRAASAGDRPAELITPAPGSTLTSSAVTFAWTGGWGVERYRLEVGSAPGGTDLFDQDAHGNLTTTVAGLPSEGHTIYVRLWSLIAGRWAFKDYTYTTPSAIVEPPMAALPRENRDNRVGAVFDRDDK